MKQHRFDESFNEIQEAVGELYSESYMEDHLKVGDWIMQKQRSDYDNSYGIVVDVLKNGGYKALVVGGWSSKPALKSTKGWDPKPVKISKGDIPSKWLKKLESRASALGIVLESEEDLNEVRDTKKLADIHNKLDKQKELDAKFTKSKKDLLNRFSKVEKLGDTYFAELDALMSDYGQTLSHFDKKRGTTAYHKDLFKAMDYIDNHIKTLKSELNKRS